MKNKVPTVIPPSKFAWLVSAFGCGDWFSFFVFLFMYPAVWYLATKVNEPWAYTMRGVALMLLPVQWAFYLGQKSRGLNQ